jgi:putative spermidine/putrescine transport system substrate-binding protein
LLSWHLSLSSKCNLAQLAASDFPKMRWLILITLVASVSWPVHAQQQQPAAPVEPNAGVPQSAPTEPPAQATTPEPSPSAETVTGSSADSGTDPKPSAQPAPVTKLTVATWGGAYGQSQQRVFFEPFTAARGTRIDSVTHDGSLDALRRIAAKPEPAWDIVDLSSGVLDEACAEGLLVKFAPGEAPYPTDRDDFIPGAVRECGIGSVAWSALPVYDNRAFPKRKPAAPADVFDLRQFPGKRSFPRSPRYMLELALLADGVAPADVYATLSTAEGVNRAFAMLDKVRAETIWWQSATEPLEHLRNRKAAIALAYNGRAFSAIVAERQPFALLWSGQIYDVNLWGILAASPRKDAARDFIAFASAPQQLAAQARWFPYGPARRSASALVTSHAELPLDMADYLPTSERNFKTALAYDAAFWAKAETELSERFDDWIEGRVDANGDAVAESAAGSIPTVPVRRQGVAR